MEHAESTVALTARKSRRMRLSRTSLVRRIHITLALAFWSGLMIIGSPSLRSVIATLVLTATWSLALEGTVLSQTPHQRSSAWCAVMIACALAVQLVVVVALGAVTHLPASQSHVVLGTMEVAAIALLWQLYALRTPLGRPLRCLLVGRPAAARLLLREPLAPGAAPFELVGLIDDRPTSGDAPVDHDSSSPIQFRGGYDALDDVLAREDIDLVVVGARGGRPEVFARLLAVSRPRFRVVELPDFFESQFGRVPVDEITSVWFLDALRHTHEGPSAFSKRALDVIVATLLMVLTAPLFLAVAIAIRVTSPGPIIYRQRRVGEHGRAFTVLKLRSMRIDAERNGAVWASKDDNRVTAIGGALRRYRIDELPQLWNVLRGDMTMVGPRPERPEFVGDLVESVPFYQPRHMTKPGLTGWAQVSDGYAASLDDARRKLSYDLYYIKHRGLALDIAILLRTASVVLRGTGAR